MSLCPAPLHCPTQPVCAIRGISMCGGVVSQHGTNRPGTSQGVKTMNQRFSYTQAGCYRGSLGWLDGRSGGHGWPWPPWGNTRNTGAQMQPKLAGEQDQEELPERKGSESPANMYLGGGPGVSKPSRLSVSLAILARTWGARLRLYVLLTQRAKLSFKEVASRKLARKSKGGFPKQQLAP